MKILLITQEPPLLSEVVVSGNAVRTRQISQALENAGHEVVQVWLSKDRKRVDGAFRNRDELQGILMKQAPGAIIVSYWELLGLLPYGLRQPVILDYVAPRSLEEIYESPGTVRNSMRRLRLNLQHCDAVMVGNGKQRHLLLNTMIEAGFDVRDSNPVLIVPLGAEVAGPPHSDPMKNGWLLVAGGVSWPWRKSEYYTAELERIANEMRPALRLVLFGGRYRWHEQQDGSGTKIPGLTSGDSDEATVSRRDLESYRHFSNYLSEHAHIGVELAEWNVERQYSQSFRSLEFLRHGLPLLCNRYLPIARLVEKYDAGWTVDEPGSLASLLPKIVSRPDEWRKKSENALKLVSRELRPDRSVRPLLEWLESASKAERLPEIPASADEEPVLGVPPLGQRLKHQFKLVRQVLIGRLYGQDKGSGVLLVTRSDLFPPDHGAAVRTVETARALSQSGLRVGIVTEERKFWYRFIDGKVEQEKFPFWVKMLSLPAPLVKLLHYSKDIPFSNSFLYMPLTDRSFQWRIVAVAKQLHAGILQAEFPAYALPCIKLREAMDCGVVLVEHNVEYDRIRVQVEELTEAQYENLKSIEITLCNDSNAVVCVSDNDRRKLELDGVRPELMQTIPHGVDLEQYEELPAEDARAHFGISENEPVLFYHGTFSYPPNREALRLFAEILLPGLELQGLKAHLLAVGKNPPAISPHPRIHLTGSVERVAPWLKAADLAVIPLTDGGGTRMKIIDCFAACLPVISTSKGIEGIPVVPGQHALVIDNWDSMIEAICECWETPDKAQALAREGRALAESMDWKAIAEKYNSLYATLP
jgi:glycosyltransferase involved in cell wall biosynthesis